MRSIAFLLVGVVGATTACAATAPFLSPLFGHHMMLQRDKTNAIWGWSQPGENVRVEISGQSVTTKAGPDGRWLARLLPPAAGGPYALTVSGPQSVTLTNILVGDIWLCGGQSNMEWPLSRAHNGGAEVAAANHPHIRLFNVKSRAAYAPTTELDGTWKVCSPQTVTEDGGVSAVGYFFARKVRSETNVPIGLIKVAWGGTPAESWTSAGTLRPLNDFTAALTEIERLRTKGGPEYGNYLSHWLDEFDVGQREHWSAPTLNDHDWQRVNVPGQLAELGLAEIPGVAYLRKAVVLPDSLPAGPARIQLGVVERMDTVFINGRWVGASAWVENPRNYQIGADVLRPGTNVIVVRVFKTRPDGGFRSRPGEIRLTLGDGTVVALGGYWQGKLSVAAAPPHPLPLGFENWPTMPAVLHNGMIAPLAPFAICGALWYQGEANVGRAAQYQRLLPAMIADWRQTFQQGDFPFYIVSLAAFTPRKEIPGDDAWAELREAQARVARSVPHSGLAIAIDVGDAHDIHPVAKKEVGERLALWALAKQYGIKMPCSGPTFDRAEPLPGALRLYFQNTAGGLVVKGDKLGEFSVAGADGKWFWADARIEGDTVIVSASNVAAPKMARYAWQANPMATLFNAAGLPAVPFQTGHY